MNGLSGYNKINELPTVFELRTRGSWVRILPGAPVVSNFCVEASRCYFVVKIEHSAEALAAANTNLINSLNRQRPDQPIVQALMVSFLIVM